MNTTRPDGAEALLHAVREALRSEPRLGRRFRPEKLGLDADGTLTIVGEAPDVAAKKTALNRAAAVPGVVAIVDRLHVTPAARMGDGQIRSHLRRFFTREPGFRGFWIREMTGETAANAPEFRTIAGDPATARHRIDIEVRQGVVILNGTAPGHVSRRLAGAMAWWIPGVRDVVNGIEAEGGEEDGPTLLAEAVRAVHEADPYLDAGQIRVGVRGNAVRLTGLLRSSALRDLAERDAWGVLGVSEVINEIEVKP